MAFDDELGYDPSQPQKPDQKYTLSAVGLVSRTIDLWIKKLVSYILIIGVVSAGLLVVSYVVLLTMFDITGVIASDPFSFFLTVYLLEPTIDPLYVNTSLVYSGVFFIVSAIMAGAVIKFTLDSYGEDRGDIGLSFRHSLGKILSFLIYQIIVSILVAIVMGPGLYFMSTAMGMIDLETFDPMNPEFPPGFAEALMAGFLILVVGVIFLLFIQTRLAPTLAIIIATDLSVIGSIKRAWSLTSGSFFRILAAQILLIIATTIFTFAISYGVSFILGDTAFAYVIESIIIALLFSALSLIFIPILYRDLESREAAPPTTW